MSDLALGRSSIARTAEQPLVDLDAYFARIGYRGPATPTLATLRALHELHPAAIPFEAIDVQLGRGVDIRPAAIDAKLLSGGRGGYCHEHNGLFKRVLMTLGFEVESLMARVLWMVPAGASLPRGHMALRVMVDGAPYLADVGFGGCVPTAPLLLSTNDPQPTSHETFRFVRSSDGYLLEAQRGDDWLPMYDLVDKAQNDADFEMMNWFTATHPDSPFKRYLMAARVTPEARYGLRDNRLTVRTPDGRTEHKVLDADEIERALRDIFGLAVEKDWRPIIEKAAQASA